MSDSKETGFLDNRNKVIDVNKIFVILLSRWYLIVGSILVSLLTANLMLRYAQPIYLAELTLKLEDEKPNQLNDIFKFGRPAGKLDNLLKTESEIIKSRTMGIKTLKKLNYFITYSIKGSIISRELYPNIFFYISYLYVDSSFKNNKYVIKFKNVSTFEIGIDDGNVQQNDFETHHINDTFIFNRSLLIVNLTNENLLKSYLGIPINFKINDIVSLASSYSSNLNVEIEKGASILNMSFSSKNAEFSADYLNAITQVYIDESVNLKSQALQQTLTFLNDQLIDLSQKVRTSQNDLTSFKTQNKGGELDDVGIKQLDKLTKLETERNILQLNLRMLLQLEANVKNPKNKSLSYMTFDNEDFQALPQLFSLLNILLMEKISLLSQHTSNSPIVIENQKKLDEVKESILKNIASLKEKLAEKINYNNNLISETNGELSSLPAKQQNLINMQREFKVNEKVYNYLLEKKLETSISRSSIISNATVIDNALIPTNPISPKKDKNYLTALIIGFGFGMSLIFIIRLLNQKIPDKETIESLSNTPVIGVIKKVNSDEEQNAEYDVYVFKGPKSIFTESIRGIRTNINFILKGEKNKSISVTSTVSGEGKTFCAINIAASLTMLNYKVIIVGCDLRRPKIHLSFQGMSNDIGLTTYLIKKNTLDEVILKTDFENLYVLPAGPTPPNPAELLQTDEMEKLSAILKTDFDYVIFDNAPVGIVSDAFSLMEKADLNLFIIRAQYSKRDFALIPDRLKIESEIPNLYTILNAYEETSVTYSSIYKLEKGGAASGGGYGYYYVGYNGGYGYYGKKYYSSYYSGYYSDEEPKQKWWMKLFNKKRKKTNNV